MKPAKKLLIIDGYNVIHGLADYAQLANHQLEEARDKLNHAINELVSMQGKNAMIVYDAYNVVGMAKTHEQIGVTQVVFTNQHETADSYIEKYLSRLSRIESMDVIVVTNDFAEQQMVLGNGASRMTIRELQLQINQMHRSIRQNLQKQSQKKSPNMGSIESFLDPKTRERFEKMRKE